MYRVGKSRPVEVCPPLKTRKDAERWRIARAANQGVPAISYHIWTEEEANRILMDKEYPLEGYYSKTPWYPENWVEEPSENEYGEIAP